MDESTSATNNPLLFLLQGSQSPRRAPKYPKCFVFSGLGPLLLAVSQSHKEWEP